MVRKQSGLLVLSTPLGQDALQIRAFRGTEQISRPFQYELELVSDDSDIEFDKIVGQQATVQLVLGGGGVHRYFNGYISRFALTRCLGHMTEYRATMVPWLWFLTRSADCRIFQEKAAPDIIKEIFQEHGFASAFDKGSLREHPKLSYCVQYRETDFNFVSRLMEAEGICYYFKHANGKHTLVMADSKNGHSTFDGYGMIPYQPPTQEFRGKETIHEWALEQEVQTGAYALNDFDFKNPRASVLLSTTKSPEQQSYPSYEIFDYPGGYMVKGDGEVYSRARIEELRAQGEIARGESDARGIATGCLFTLAGFPRADQCREYLITSVNYSIECADEAASGAADGGGTGTCSCTFTAIPADKPFRPPRITPKPAVKGPQTAIVVGKSGEEIWTDEFGRVRLQFHWDRYGKSDENSSCWVRVAQVWAGKTWGVIYTPRIGQEVIVEFLEGDPDQPIVTGRVYNKEQMPPYALPAGMTRSTIKSNSSKGGAGFNEIRFEDKKGEEQIFIHAEGDMAVDVKKNRIEQTQKDQHLIVGTEKDKIGDRFELVCRDDHLHVKQHHVEHVEGNTQLTIGKGSADGGNLDVIVEKTKKEEVGEESHLHVKGDCLEKVDGDLSLTIGGKDHKKVGTAYAVDAGQEVHIKGGMKVIIEAGMQLSLKAAGSFVDIGPAGVSIQGIMVMINSGGSAGSGGGASPKSPKDPIVAAPAAPQTPGT